METSSPASGSENPDQIPSSFPKDEKSQKNHPKTKKKSPKNQIYPPAFPAFSQLSPSFFPSEMFTSPLRGQHAGEVRPWMRLQRRRLPQFQDLTVAQNHHQVVVLERRLSNVTRHAKQRSMAGWLNGIRDLFLVDFMGFWGKWRIGCTLW